MTHDELLETIDFLPLEGLHSWMQPALRAVVELHRPAWWNSRDTDIKEAYCYGCEDRCGCYEGDILSYNRWETCPTIQSIEEQLK